jgi:hypothetical protein
MPGLVPGIHVLRGADKQGVDGRNKSGHDDREAERKAGRVSLRRAQTYLRHPEVRALASLEG